MTHPTNKLREALEALDKLYSAALESEYRSYGNPDDLVETIHAALTGEHTYNPATHIIIAKDGILTEEMLFELVDGFYYAHGFAPWIRAGK